MGSVIITDEGAGAMCMCIDDDDDIVDDLEGACAVGVIVADNLNGMCVPGVSSSLKLQMRGCV